MALGNVILLTAGLPMRWISGPWVKHVKKVKLITEDVQAVRGFADTARVVEGDYH